MFLMALGIPGTFGFADYESGGGGGRGSDTGSHFDCIIDLLLIINIINWLYY